MATYIVGGIFLIIVSLATYKTIVDAKKGGCAGCKGSCNTNCNKK